MQICVICGNALQLNKELNRQLKKSGMRMPLPFTLKEKEFFDKLNIDQGVLRQIKANSESMKNNYIKNIDMMAKLCDEYIKMRISAIQSFDNYVHVTMKSYAKMLSQFTKSKHSSD